MRIVAGKLKGRNFESVHGHRTHPMSEKIRGAIFNTLGDLSGLTVLDLYAGTGALGFEAISRGAHSALLIDADVKAYKTINQNITTLGLSGVVRAIKIYAHAWSRRFPNEQFDIVLMDPPYDAVVPKDILNLTKHTRKGGLIVLSLPPGSGFLLAPSRQELLLHKNYGDAELYFYRQLI